MVIAPLVSSAFRRLVVLPVRDPLDHVEPVRSRLQCLSAFSGPASNKGKCNICGGVDTCLQCLSAFSGPARWRRRVRVEPMASPVSSAFRRLVVLPASRPTPCPGFPGAVSSAFRRLVVLPVVRGGDHLRPPL